jgi:hypothetical protein
MIAERIGGMLHGPAARLGRPDRFISARSWQTEKRRMLWSVVPVVARSVMISPITGANLKPCPEQGEATIPALWPAAGR